MNAAFRRSLAGLVVTAVAIALAAFWLPHLKQARTTASDTALQSACDLNRKPCTVALAGERTIEFSIAPRPVPVMKPLTLHLSTRGFTAPPTAQVDFSGAGMDMGFNRVELRRQADGSMSGEASLPLCVTGSMDWQAELRISVAEGARPTAISFRFRAPLPAAD